MNNSPFRGFPATKPPSRGLPHTTRYAGIVGDCNEIYLSMWPDPKTTRTTRNCKPVIAIDWDKERFSENNDSKTVKLLEEYNLK